MKNSFGALVAVTLAALIGCTQGIAGGPGATGKNPAFGQANDTFNLSVPVMSSPLQRGKQSEMTIGIQRGDNFDEDVALQIADVPTGVTFEPANPLIKHGETDAMITFRAVDDAPLGNFAIKITGHPTNGSDAQVDFKLTVAAKDGFALSMPHQSTRKQGNTQVVSIGFKKGKTFDQDVALKFGSIPTGVALTPSAPVIKHCDAQAQIVLTGADDATLGNFAIERTGHPTNGDDSATVLNFTVVKE